MEGNKFYIMSIMICVVILLLSGCSIKPKTIFSERECEMSQTELVNTITSILQMNNFTVNFADSSMISATSNSSISFGFNPFLNNRADVVRYHIKWDFIILRSANNPNKFKIISNCYKVNNRIGANISTTNPQLNYSENIFAVGRHYHRGRTDAMFYWSVIDALRHICGMEIEHYFDKHGRELKYNTRNNKFYLLKK